MQLSSLRMIAYNLTEYPRIIYRYLVEYIGLVNKLSFWVSHSLLDQIIEHFDMKSSKIILIAILSVKIRSCSI